MKERTLVVGSIETFFGDIREFPCVLTSPGREHPQKSVDANLSSSISLLDDMVSLYSFSNWLIETLKQCKQ